MESLTPKAIVWCHAPQRDVESWVGEPPPLSRCSDLPGFEQRMQQELEQLVDTELTRARCHHPGRGLHSAFFGGCAVLASDLYGVLAVSRKEYQEQGGDGICRGRFWADFL